MEQQELQDVLTQLPKAIKWVIPDSIRTDHATHMIVQQQGTEFTFLFFEVAAPLFMGPPEEQIEAYKALEHIEAKCVAKVVMSAENVTLGANNLIESINRFNMMMLQAAKGQENAGTRNSTETPESARFSASS